MKVAAAFALLLLAVPALGVTQPNLLVNLTFDANANSWGTLDIAGDVAYTTSHADGGHPAGSILVTNLGSPNVYAFQCIPISGGATYEFVGDIYLLSGEAWITLQFTSAATCVSFDLATASSDPVTTTNVWRNRPGMVRAPDTANAVVFELNVVNSGSQAQFDNLSLKRVPIRGDVNGDLVVDVADVFYLINYLFAGGPEPPLP